MSERPGDGQGVVLRNGLVLTMDDAHTVLPDADVLVTGDRIAEVGAGLSVPGRHPRDRRARRHRHAGHDRHPPAHVADRDARLRRRLDAHPVLRLVLPGVRQALPPAGRARGQPAGRRWRPSTPASPPASTGRTACRPIEHAEAAVDALRTVPGRFVLAYGNIQQAPWEWSASAGLPGLRAAPDRRPRRHARLPDGLRRDRRPGVPRAGGLRGGPRAGRARHHARRGLGRDQRRRHPARPRGRLPRRVEHLRARRHAVRRLLPAHRRHRRLGVGVDRERAERRARATRPPGRCARTASRCRCRWTPACGGAATCSPPCAPRWAPTAPASTWRRTPRATPSPTARCAPSRSSTGPPAAAPKALGRDADLGSLERGQEGRRRAAQERRTHRCRSRCSTRTGTWRSRPSAATCTRCWWTGGW